jgi:hypothetical protein
MSFRIIEPRVIAVCSSPQPTLPPSLYWSPTCLAIYFGDTPAVSAKTYGKGRQTSYTRAEVRLIT